MAIKTASSWSMITFIIGNHTNLKVDEVKHAAKELTYIYQIYNFSLS